jgi:hypothetical protein
MKKSKRYEKVGRKKDTVNRDTIEFAEIKLSHNGQVILRELYRSWWSQEELARALGHRSTGNVRRWINTFNDLELLDRDKSRPKKYRIKSKELIRLVVSKPILEWVKTHDKVDDDGDFEENFLEFIETIDAFFGSEAVRQSVRQSDSETVSKNKKKSIVFEDASIREDLPSNNLSKWIYSSILSGFLVGFIGEKLYDGNDDDEDLKEYEIDDLRDKLCHYLAKWEYPGILPFFLENGASLDAEWIHSYLKTI